MERIKKYGYNIGDLIGAGSMGSVYRAHDFVEDRDVALKILHPALGNDPELKERFFREARVAASLRHPNIVDVFDRDELNEMPFLVMELLSGADVRDYISKQRPATLAEKVEFIAQVCDGLAEAHRVAVHRDIKPSNIFIHEDAEAGTKIAKILDFGIARIADSKLTVAGRVLGTPNYMAPEQIETGHCDSRADLFSVSIVLYEFLAGVHPFHGNIIPRRILEEEPDALHIHNPLVPRQLEDLIDHGLQKDPGKRIATAGEFSQQLRAFLEDLRAGRTGVVRPGVSMPSSQFATAGNRMESEGAESGRFQTFLGLVKEFERQIAVSDVANATRTLERLKTLAAEDAEYETSIRQCQDELSVVRKRIEPIALAVGAGGGGAGAGASNRNMPVEGMATQILPLLQGWDRAPGFGGPAAGGGDGSDPDILSPVMSVEVLTLICEACGMANRDSAKFCRQCGANLLARLPINGMEGTGVKDEADSELTREPFPGGGNGWFIRARDRSGQVLAAMFQTLKDIIRHVALLPMRKKLLLGAVILAGFIVLTVAVSMEFTPSSPLERAYATAVVNVPQTHLWSAPGGKQLLVLPKGSRVNILDPITSLAKPYMKAQFVSPRRNSPPGFVWTGDLTQWTTDDAVSSWTILGLSRPKSNATEAEQRNFIEALRNFSNKYPGTAQDKLANLEQAKLFVFFVEQSKAAGKPQSEWQADAVRAQTALRGAGTSDPAEIARLTQVLEEINKPVPDVIPTPAAAVVRTVSPDQALLKALETKAEVCFNTTSDLDCVLEQAAQMERLDPGKAAWWRDTVARIRDRLRGKKK